MLLLEMCAKMQQEPLKDIQKRDNLHVTNKGSDKSAVTMATKLLDSAKKSHSKKTAKRAKLSLHKTTGTSQSNIVHIAVDTADTSPKKSQRKLALDSHLTVDPIEAAEFKHTDPLLKSSSNRKACPKDNSFGSEKKQGKVSVVKTNSASTTVSEVSACGKGQSNYGCLENRKNCHLDNRCEANHVPDGHDAEVKEITPIHSPEGICMLTSQLRSISSTEDFVCDRQMLLKNKVRKNAEEKMLPFTSYPIKMEADADCCETEMKDNCDLENSQSETKFSASFHLCPNCSEQQPHGNFVRHMRQCMAQTEKEKSDSDGCTALCEGKEKGDKSIEEVRVLNDSKETKCKETRDAGSSNANTGGVIGALRDDQEESREDSPWVPCNWEQQITEDDDAQTDEAMLTEYIFCHLCQKNLSHMNSHFRTQHINRCIDEAEQSRKEQEERALALEAARKQILDCPMCGKRLRSHQSRNSHLKRCAAALHVKSEQLLELVKQQQEDHCRNCAAGILPSSYRSSRNEEVSSTKHQKKLTALPKSHLDEDLQLALALSSSLQTEQLENKSLKETMAFKAASKKRKKQANDKETFLLLSLTSAQSAERIAARVSDLLMLQEEDLEEEPPLPPIYIGNLHGQYISHIFVSTDEAVQHKMFWRLSSMEEAMEEEIAERQALSDTNPQLKYYVLSLMPPIQVISRGVGSKIRSVSQIPGRRRSADHVPIQAEKIEEKTENVSEDEPIPTTQMAVLLAEMAAEADSQPQVQLSGTDHQVVSDPQVLKDLVSAFSSLVNQPEFSDLTIKTKGDTVLYAHRVVLYVRCPSLLKLATDDSRCVNLSKWTSHCVFALLKFVYAGLTDFDEDLLSDLMLLANSLGLTNLGKICENLLNPNLEEMNCDQEPSQFTASHHQYTVSDNKGKSVEDVKQDLLESFGFYNNVSITEDKIATTAVQDLDPIANSGFREDFLPLECRDENQTLKLSDSDGVNHSPSIFTQQSKKIAIETDDKHLSLSEQHQKIIETCTSSMQKLEQESTSEVKLCSMLDTSVHQKKRPLSSISDEDCDILLSSSDEDVSFQANDNVSKTLCRRNSSDVQNYSTALKKLASLNSESLNNSVTKATELTEMEGKVHKPAAEKKSKYLKESVLVDIGGRKQSAVLLNGGNSVCSLGLQNDDTLGVESMPLSTNSPEMDDSKFVASQTRTDQVTVAAYNTDRSSEETETINISDDDLFSDDDIDISLIPNTPQISLEKLNQIRSYQSCIQKEVKETWPISDASKEGDSTKVVSDSNHFSQKFHTELHLKRKHYTQGSSLSCDSEAYEQVCVESTDNNSPVASPSVKRLKRSKSLTPARSPQPSPCASSAHTSTPHHAYCAEGKEQNVDALQVDMFSASLGYTYENSSSLVTENFTDNIGRPITSLHLPVKAGGIAPTHKSEQTALDTCTSGCQSVRSLVTIPDKTRSTLQPTTSCSQKTDSRSASAALKPLFTTPPLNSCRERNSSVECHSALIKKNLFADGEESKDVSIDSDSCSNLRIHKLAEGNICIHKNSKDFVISKNCSSADSGDSDLEIINTDLENVQSPKFALSSKYSSSQLDSQYKHSSQLTWHNSPTVNQIKLDGKHSPDRLSNKLEEAVNHEACSHSLEHKGNLMENCSVSLLAGIVYDDDCEATSSPNEWEDFDYPEVHNPDFSLANTDSSSHELDYCHASTSTEKDALKSLHSTPWKRTVGKPSKMSAPTSSFSFPPSFGCGSAPGHEKKILDSSSHSPGEFVSQVEAAHASFIWSEENTPNFDDSLPNLTIEPSSKQLTPKDGKRHFTPQRRSRRNIPPSPFTPMPSYDDMTTPNLKVEVQKYGLKPVGKSRMKRMLKDIYHKTHVYETESEDEQDVIEFTKTLACEVISLLAPSNQLGKKGSHSNVGKPSKYNSQKKNSTLQAKSAPANETKRGPKRTTLRKKDLSQEKIGEDTRIPSQDLVISSNKRTSSVKCSKKTMFNLPTINEARETASSAASSGFSSSPEKGSYSSSQDSDNSIQPDVSVFEEDGIENGDDDEILLTQSSQDTDLPQRMTDFIRSRPELHIKVLTYEPLDLAVLKADLKAANIRCSQKMLLDFLDEKCITFTTKNIAPRHRHQGKRRQRKKTSASQ